MAHAVDADQDLGHAGEPEEAGPVTGLGILPQGLMNPTGPAPERIHDDPAPMVDTGPAPATRPDRQGLLVRLGHRLCGFRG